MHNRLLHTVSTRDLWTSPVARSLFQSGRLRCAFRTAKSLFLGAALLIPGGGCVLTRAVTAPMRVGGAVLTIIPGVGDAAHSAIDTAAEQIDDIPL